MAITERNLARLHRHLLSLLSVANPVGCQRHFRAANALIRRYVTTSLRSCSRQRARSPAVHYLRHLANWQRHRTLQKRSPCPVCRRHFNYTSLTDKALSNCFQSVHCCWTPTDFVWIQTKPKRSSLGRTTARQRSEPQVDDVTVAGVTAPVTRTVKRLSVTRQ